MENKEEKMKKLALLLLTLIMVFSFAACGGDKKDNSGESSSSEASKSDEPEEPVDDRETFNFVKVTLPDGWEYEDRDNSSQVYLVDSSESGRKIQINLAEPPEECYAKYEKLYADSDQPYEKLDDKTFGEYTYLAAIFEWNKKPSLSLITDNPFRPGYGISVNCFEIPEDDPIIAEVMSTVTYFDPEEEK